MGNAIFSFGFACVTEVRHMLYTSHLHYSWQVSRTTSDNMHLICICPDSMQMTCTYTDNNSKDDMYITYAFLNSIQMTFTICVCVDNMQKLSCDNKVYEEC